MSVATSTTTRKRAFIGRAWVNKPKNDGEKFNISVKLDRDVVGMNLVLANGETINVTPIERNGKKAIDLLLWPNSKREGKKDADLRLSVALPV